MSRAWSALAAGISGTAVLSVLLLIPEVETRSALGIFGAIPRFGRIPNDVAVGVLVCLATGIVAWPLVFVAVEGWLPLGDVATRAMGFGVVLRVAFVLSIVVWLFNVVHSARVGERVTSSDPWELAATGQRSREWLWFARRRGPGTNDGAEAPDGRRGDCRPTDDRASVWRTNERSRARFDV